MTGRAKSSLTTQNSILLLSVILVVWIIGFPLFNIIRNSFLSGSALDVSAYGRVFTSSKTYKALFNTLYVAFGVLLVAGAMGGGLAFLTEKTDFRYKKLIRFLVFLAFCVPSYIISVSWIQITARGGYLHRLLRLFAPEMAYTFSPYSFTAVIIVLSVHLYPLVFFGASNALRNRYTVLEDAARLAGGRPWRVFQTISLPLVLPSFLSVGLLVLSRTMANFGIPAQLALPFGGEVLTTRIYKAISELDIQSLSILSILLIAISYTLYYASQRWIQKRAFYTDNASPSFSGALVKLGSKAWLVNLLVLVFFAAVLIIPMITLFVSSLMKRWGLPITAENMTINNYAIVLFQNPMMKRAFLNSFVYGVVSAGTAACIAVLIVYLHRFSKSKLTGFLLSVASLPLSVPNIILAVGAIFAWINPPFKLYGTKWILMLTYLVLFIPICIKQIQGLAQSVNPSIDLSAKTLGIPVWRRMTRLFVPQVFKGVTAGFIISFLIAFREIPISLLLYSKGNETVGVLLFTIQSNSYGLEMTSAIAVIVIFISIIGNLLVQKISKRRWVHENAASE